MTTINKHATGTPIWADLSTPNLDAAIEFYNKIFGWEIVKGPAKLNFYSNAKLNGRLVAGLVPQMPDNKAPSSWTQYLASENADATAAAVTQNHGKIIHPPMTVVNEGRDLGRMCVATDPSGGMFGFWEPHEHVGTEVENEAGAPVWTELRSTNAAQARDFFEDTFGLKFSKMEGAPIEYYTTTSNEQMVYGIMQMDETMRDTATYWSPHFGVSDIDASCKDIANAGGKVMHGPEASPYGRWAFVADPFGASFTIMEVVKTGEQ